MRAAGARGRRGGAARRAPGARRRRPAVARATPSSRCAPRSAPPARDLALFAEAFAAVFAVEEHPTNPLAALGEIERAALPRVGVPQPATERTRAASSATCRCPPPRATRSCCARRTSPSYTDAERALARRLLARIAARSPQRAQPPHARRRAAAREVHDLRATVRASLRHGGELIERRYREPGLNARAGSCSSATSRARWRRTRGCCCSTCRRRVAARARVEAFVFGTRLTRVTRELARPRSGPRAARAPPSTSPTGRAAPGSAPRWPSSTASTAAGSAAAPSSCPLRRLGPRRPRRCSATEMARLRRTAHRLAVAEPARRRPALRAAHARDARRPAARRPPAAGQLDRLAGSAGRPDGGRTVMKDVLEGRRRLDARAATRSRWPP